MLSLPQFKEKLTLTGGADWSFAPTLEFFWGFDMQASREEIWPYLSDTSRLNRELDLAPRKQEERDGKTFVTTTMLGIGQQ